MLLQLTLAVSEMRILCCQERFAHPLREAMAETIVWFSWVA